MSEPELLVGEDAARRLESKVLDAVIMAMRAAFEQEGLSGAATVSACFATDYAAEAGLFLEDGKLNATTRGLVAGALLATRVKKRV